MHFPDSFNISPFYWNKTSPVPVRTKNIEFSSRQGFPLFKPIFTLLPPSHPSPIVPPESDHPKDKLLLILQNKLGISELLGCKIINALVLKEMVICKTILDVLDKAVSNEAGPKLPTIISAHSLQLWFFCWKHCCGARFKKIKDIYLRGRRQILACSFYRIRWTVFP